jgi:hypothetical protein
MPTPDYHDCPAVVLARELDGLVAAALDATRDSLQAAEQTNALREAMLAALARGEDSGDLMAAWVTALEQCVTLSVRGRELERIAATLRPLADAAVQQFHVYLDTIEHPERLN